MSKAKAPKAPKARGFAYMKLHDPDRLHEVSTRAGRQVQKQGKGYRWTKEQAKKMAGKGGRARWGITKIKL